MLVWKTLKREQIIIIFLVRRPGVVLINKKKKNLPPSEFCHSSHTLSENKGKWKYWQIREPYLRIKKVMEHENDSDIDCCWCACNSPQKLRKGNGRIGNKRKN